MAKGYCFICYKPTGFFDLRLTVSDGSICSDCCKKGMLFNLDNPMSYTVKQVSELIESRKPLVETYHETKSFSYRFGIDEQNKLFLADGNLFRYENLLNFELYEDGNTVMKSKGTIGRSIVGGMLYGGTGAIIGGMTSKKVSHDTCTSLGIRLTLKDALCSSLCIDFIFGNTRKDTTNYINARDTAYKIMSALEIIADYNAEQNQQFSQIGFISAADEILKFKQLLDMGVITSDEFEIKKKQLLGGDTKTNYSLPTQSDFDEQESTKDKSLGTPPEFHVDLDSIPKKKLEIEYDDENDSDEADTEDKEENVQSRFLWVFLVIIIAILVIITSSHNIN